MLYFCNYKINNKRVLRTEDILLIFWSSFIDFILLFASSTRQEKLFVNLFWVFSFMHTKPLTSRSAFFFLNCPFLLKWVTLPCHTKSYTDLYFPPRSGERSLRQSDNLLFDQNWWVFSPFLLRHKGKKNYFQSGAHLLPFQWCVTLFYLISFVHFHHCYSLWFPRIAERRS